MPKAMATASNCEERLRGVSWQRVAVVLRAFIKSLPLVWPLVRQAFVKQEARGRLYGSAAQRQVRSGEERSAGSKTVADEEDDSGEEVGESGERPQPVSNCVKQSC